MQQNIKILIVDNNVHERSFLQQMLSSKSRPQFELAVANDMLGLNYLLEKNTINVILINYALIDQSQECKHVVRHLIENYPVIFILNSEEEKNIQRYMRTGAQDYLIRGKYDDSALIKTISNAIYRYNVNKQILLKCKVVTILANAINLNDGARAMLANIREYLHCSLSEIWAYDPHANLLRNVLTTVNDNRYNDIIRFNYGQTFVKGVGIPGHVWDMDAACVISDITNDPHVMKREIFDTLTIRSAMGVPVKFNDELIGVVVFYSDSITHYDTQTLNFITAIMHQIGAYIKRRRIPNDLLYLTHHDLLTGLDDRIVFENTINETISLYQHNQNLMALLYIDIDHFKALNKTNQLVGDRILQEVANRIRKTIRSRDSAARYGGDEFAVLLPGVISKENTAKVAKKILEQIALPYEVDGHIYQITASMGISLYPNDGANVVQLLKNADIAVYEAKQNGEGTFAFCESNNNELKEKKRKLKNELHSALDKDQFKIYYQPIINIKENAITGLEALLRWHHPDKTVITPDDFITILEENNLITRVGEWVLRSACKSTKSLHEAGHAHVSISINISVHQLTRSFVSVVANILQDTALDPARLTIELTEGSLMHDTENNIYLLQALKDLGINISIDDFGTGYSSLAYVNKFAIDVLKIDKSFVAGIPDNANSIAIINAIIAMAHSLNLKVIAEGVENQSQLDFLRERNCDEYQGYFGSHPIQVEDLIALLEKKVH